MCAFSEISLMTERTNSIDAPFSHVLSFRDSGFFYFFLFSFLSRDGKKTWVTELRENEKMRENCIYLESRRRYQMVLGIAY